MDCIVHGVAKSLTVEGEWKAMRNKLSLADFFLLEGVTLSASSSVFLSEDQCRVV